MGKIWNMNGYCIVINYLTILSTINQKSDTWYGYGSIPMKIPFLVGWTSINPSYFEVHQGYKVLTHCHIMNESSASKSLNMFLLRKSLSSSLSSSGFLHVLPEFLGHHSCSFAKLGCCNSWGQKKHPHVTTFLWALGLPSPIYGGIPP